MDDTRPKHQEEMSARTASKEDEFFRKHERELREQQERERNDAEAKKLRELHFMKCPKCGHDLHEEGLGGIVIDRCGTCKGVWLDPGELDELTKKEKGSIFGKLFGR